MYWVDRVTPFLYRLAKRSAWLRVAWKYLQRGKQRFALKANVSVPEGVIDDLAALAASGERDNFGIIDFQPGRGSWVETRPLPSSIYEASHWKFTDNAVYEHPECFVVTLSGGRCWNQGSVITRNNQLAAQVSFVIERGAYSKQPRDHPIFKAGRLPAPRKLQGRGLLLAAYAGRGYYHWMCDVLPRLQIFREAGLSLGDVDHVVVNHYVSSFQMETMTKLGIARDKIVQLENVRHVELDELVTPSLAGDTGQVPRWVCDFLREEFLPSHPEGASRFGKRLYISRSKTGHRKVTNDAAIISMLKGLGFDIVHLEDLSLLEQASAMSQAEVVLAPHGAGLVNIVFCSPATKVVELFHNSAVNVMFWSIAQAMDLDYYYLLSEDPQPDYHEDLYLNAEDMSFDIDELRETLRLAGIAD